jgi:hypothetical protein
METPVLNRRLTLSMLSFTVSFVQRTVRRSSAGDEEYSTHSFSCQHFLQKKFIFFYFFSARPPLPALSPFGGRKYEIKKTEKNRRKPEKTGGKGRQAQSSRRKNGKRRKKERGWKREKHKMNRRGCPGN